MLSEWIILCLLIILPIIAAVNGKRNKALQPSNKIRFYTTDIIESIVLLAIFFILKPSMYYPLDFSSLTRG